MTITEFLEARINEDEQLAAKHLDAGTFQDVATRCLAECAAKREILAWRARSDLNTSSDYWEMGYSDANYEALQALARVYKDHPDYRQDWTA